MKPTKRDLEIANRLIYDAESSSEPYDMVDHIAKALADARQEVYMKNKQKIDNDLMERLADLEHQRWSRWHKHAKKNWNPESIKRWDELADTPYEELSEELKQKDRDEVKHEIAKALQEVRDEKQEELGKQDAEIIVLKGRLADERKRVLESNEIKSLRDYTDHAEFCNERGERMGNDCECGYFRIVNQFQKFKEENLK